MISNKLTFSKNDAENHLSRNRRNNQIYIYKFDADVVYRRGKLDDEQIGKVRYKEDARPQKIYNKRTQSERDKVNDVVTFKMPNSTDLYVLGKSGGVSLFDGISSKVSLGKKDCWWIITKEAKLEEGLVIAKDLFADKEGNVHYSIEADRDMLLSEYIEKLNMLKEFMRKRFV